jgi:ArsR family transcriptional regulator, arsenate/arsenite/antimonite-responsive transcriptional repressor
MPEESDGPFAGLREYLNPRLFKALCDPTRLAILAELAEAGEPCTVGRLAESRPVDPSVVSRHLGVLRDAQIVEASRHGREVFYRVRYQGLAQSLRAVADAIDRCCPPGAPDRESQHETADQDA